MNPTLWQWKHRLESAFYKTFCFVSPRQREFNRANLRAIQEHGVSSWFGRLPCERSYSREALNVLESHARRELPVHDLGTGIGQELVELHYRGFQELYGCDIELHQVRAAEQLLRDMRVEACCRQADGISYLESLPSNSAGVILALNWTYRLEPADLHLFLQQALHRLHAQRGLLLIDIIRSDYQPTAWERDEYQRSYPVKWLPAQFEETAQRVGGEVFHRTRRTHPWGRMVYALRRSASA